MSDWPSLDLRQWTNTRAIYLDNLSGGAVALASTALSTATWTSTRAGYIDNLNLSNPVQQQARNTTQTYMRWSGSGSLATYTSWQQVVASVASEVVCIHITGISTVGIGSDRIKVELGTGGAGSEVVQAGAVVETIGVSQGGHFNMIIPLRIASSTRIAVRSLNIDSANAEDTWCSVNIFRV